MLMVAPSGRGTMITRKIRQNSSFVTEVVIGREPLLLVVLAVTANPYLPDPLQPFLYREPCQKRLPSEYTSVNKDYIGSINRENQLSERSKDFQTICTN